MKGGACSAAPAAAVTQPAPLVNAQFPGAGGGTTNRSEGNCRHMTSGGRSRGERRGDRTKQRGTPVGRPRPGEAETAACRTPWRGPGRQDAPNSRSGKQRVPRFGVRGRLDFSIPDLHAADVVEVRAQSAHRSRDARIANLRLTRRSGTGKKGQGSPSCNPPAFAGGLCNTQATPFSQCRISSPRNSSPGAPLPDGRAPKRAFRVRLCMTA